MTHAFELAMRTRRQRNPGARRQALISAAATLFAARGYEAATTQEIAAHAGCAEGLIHRYFGGKRGLLLALIDHRVSGELGELAHRCPLAATLTEEYLHLLSWEVDRMWQDRNFLRVIMARALVEPKFGSVLSTVGLARHVPAFIQRFDHFEEYRSLTGEKKQGLAQSIKVLGLTFGFMRPVLLGQDRSAAQSMAMTIGAATVRGFLQD